MRKVRMEVFVSIPSKHSPPPRTYYLNLTEALSVGECPHTPKKAYKVHIFAWCAYFVTTFLNQTCFIIMIISPLHR